MFLGMNDVNGGDGREARRRRTRGPNGQHALGAVLRTPGPISQVFSSVRHGDPSTPLVRAYLGDPLVANHRPFEFTTSRISGHRFRIGGSSRTRRTTR